MGRSNKKFPRTRYKKLVRDKIPELIQRRGGSPKTHRATRKEYWRKLKEKLAEEVREFSVSEDIEELADVYEVLAAIRQFKKITPAQVKKLQRKKASARGRFRRRIILDAA